MPDGPGLKVPNLELTTQQKKALRFCLEYIEEHGAMPSIRKVADHLGVYPSTAHNTLRALAARGYLKATTKTVTRTRLTMSAKGRKAAP